MLIKYSGFAPTLESSPDSQRGTYEDIMVRLNIYGYGIQINISSPTKKGYYQS
jgi:hypothetical protein